MTKQKILRPFFSFYGGKWRATKRFYPEPLFDTVVEPFAGSAGYSVRNYTKNIVLCDADPTIAGIWDYLIRVSPNEILEIPDVDLEGEVDDLHLIPEAAALVGFWLARTSTIPRSTPSGWMKKGKWPGSFWGDRVRNTIASQVDLIRHWKIYNVDYASCPVTCKSTWFVDPPYQVQGQSYRFGSRSIDYAHLGQWCKDRPGQVIACESQGAIWLPFAPVGTVSTTSKKTRSEEAVWLKNS